MSTKKVEPENLSNFFNQSDSVRSFENVNNLENVKLHEISSNQLLELKRDEKIQIENSEVKSSVCIQKNLSENGISKIIVSNCRTKSDIFEIIDHLTTSDEVLLIILKFNEDLPKLRIEDFQLISTKFNNKSVVLTLESDCEEDFSIAWKFKEFEHFWMLKNNTEELEKEERMNLKDFVSEFLTKSLKSQHTGLMSKFKQQQGTKLVDLDFLADFRDFNLLLLATESGNAELVKILIKLNQKIKSYDNSVDARNLALQNNQQDIFLIFLKANMTFPSSFDATNCTGKLKDFCDATQELHQLIMDNNVEKVKDILDQHESMKFFFNFQNKSAVRVALQSRSFDTYKLLFSRDYRYGSHENPKAYLDKLERSDKRLVRDIHTLYSQHFDDKHINILIANSHVFQGQSQSRDKRLIIQKVFETLNTNLFIQIILKIVAASINFKLIFDFNRDSVDIVDPTVDEHTQGLFYLSGKIYVGAKQLLKKETEDEAIATLIHELCHFAMFLVFENNARPYRGKDKELKQEFEEISQECEANKEKETFIRLVYDCYSDDMHHAELIVRVVHLLALYRKLPEKLQEIMEIYHRLFEFYATKVVPQLEKALPEIEGRNKMESQKKDKKISKLKSYLWFGAVLAVLCVVGGIYATRLISWTCQYDQLTNPQKISIKNGIILYKSQKIKFNELFHSNSTAYDALKSEHCSALLDNQSLDFDSVNFHYLYDQVSIDLKIIQDSISNASIIYQNDTVQFHDLFADDSMAYNKLSSANISEILKDHPLDFKDLSYLYEFVSVDSQNIRSTLCNAAVLYKNVEIQFCDLFPANSTIYSKLKSDTVSQMLNNYPLDFGDDLLYYLDIQVSHSWKNLTQKLKDKFLTSNLIFQNETLKFQDLHDLVPKSFHNLTSNQIINVLSGEVLRIHEIIKTEVEFFAERKFRDENVFEIYFDFMKFVDINEKNRHYCQYFNKTQSNKTFEDHYSEFKSQNFEIQFKKILQISYLENCFKRCVFQSCLYIFQPKPGNITENLYSHQLYQGIDFDNVLVEAKKSKIFILSAEAGAGKTVTFELFTQRIKKQYPTHWVSYVDLKDHKKFYNENGNIEDIEGLIENILGLISTNEFTRRTFWEFFWSGRVILLWNGFDEISPQFSNFVQNIFGKIWFNSKNIQFVCTRPLYSDFLKFSFNTTVYTIVPFDEQSQKDFLTQLFISKNINETKIPNYIEKVYKIVNSTRAYETFGTPLLLSMIAELISNDVKIYNSENLFEIYQKFVRKKIEIWQQKSDFAATFLSDSITRHRKFDMMKLYQKYALETELASNYRYEYLKKLKIMKHVTPPELTSDEISRMGILYINGPGNVKFAHKTFSEFFIAQYLIDNIYFEDDFVSDEEAELRLEFFLDVMKYEYDTEQKVKIFLNYFIENQNVKISESLSSKFHEILKTKHKNIFFDWLKNNKKMEVLTFLLKFFQVDHNFLAEAFHVNENETLFTAAYNYHYNIFLYYNYSYANYNTSNFEYHNIQSETQLDFDELKNVTRQYLSDNEFEKFTHGRNQKGVILFSLHCYRKYPRWNVTHDEYALDDELLNIDDNFDVFEAIAKNLTKDELDELLFIKTSPLYDEVNVAFWTEERFWDFIEKNLTKSEQKQLIMNIIDSDKYSNENLVLLNQTLKFDQFFSDLEIFEFFSTKNLFLNLYAQQTARADSLYDIVLKPLWIFFANHTNITQQKFILSSRDDNSLTLLHKVLVTPFSGGESVKIIKDIYDEVFTKSELQELISMQNDFFFKLFDALFYRCDFHFAYIKELFLGNEKLLKEILERKNEDNKTIFEYFNDNYQCYKPFHELYLSLK